MSLLRTVSKTMRRNAALTAFNAGAKPFTPGVLWMKPRKIQWEKVGVSSVKYFDYKKGCESRKRGTNSRLRKMSKTSDPKSTQPFLIPEVITAKKIAKKKVSKKKLQWYGFPTVDVEELFPEVAHEESEHVKELRNIYKSCQELGTHTSKLVRTQPDRFNYCDN